MKTTILANLLIASIQEKRKINSALTKTLNTDSINTDSINIDSINPDNIKYTATNELIKNYIIEPKNTINNKNN